MAMYFAAPVTKESGAVLSNFDIKSNLHLTVFFDHSRSIKHIQLPYYPKNENGNLSGRISKISEWNPNGQVMIVAELEGTDWSHFYNKAVKSFGIVEDLPHVPHITLLKSAVAGDSDKFKDLIGMDIEFTGVFLYDLHNKK
jgi:2'-5' RNA ligase